MQELKELLVLLSVVPKTFAKVERAYLAVFLVGALELGKNVSGESQERDTIRVKPISKAPSRRTMCDLP